VEASVKKLLVLSSALLMFAVSVASAQDVRLRWNNCFGVGTNAINKNYLCDGSLNGVPQRGVFSFTSPASMNEFVGIQGVLDFTTTEAQLPDWWRLGVGECREGNFNYPGSFTGVGNTTTCLNPWTGANTGGGWAYYYQNKGDNPDTPTPWPGYGRIKFAFARDNSKVLVNGTHYVAGVFSIDTFGDDGSCAGCALPACLVQNSVELYQVSGSPPQDIYYLSAGANSYITWQGGAVPGSGCPGSTPSKSKTWGSVKALYR
jgi:hypothetical protein